jgi:hypothetical protein
LDGRAYTAERHPQSDLPRAPRDAVRDDPVKVAARKGSKPGTWVTLLSEAMGNS